MIFVTVGSELPFDRLCRPIDTWAGETGREVFAQIGPADWEPRNMKWSRFLPRAEFRARVAEAELVISHAGMGTILTAAEFGRPVLVMPRREDLRETRSDHQVATARRLVELGRVHAVEDAQALRAQLDRLDEVLAAGAVDDGSSRQRLISALRAFAAGD